MEIVVLILVRNCDPFLADDASKMVTVLGAFPDEESANDFRLGYAHSCSHGDALCIVCLDFLNGSAIHDIIVVCTENGNAEKN